MKKTLFIALGLFAMQLATAQETKNTENDTITEKRNWYVSIGVASTDGFKINSNLKAAGMPELGDTTLEIGFGHSTLYKKVLIDLELNTNVMDKKTTTDRVRNISTGFKLRGHYVPFNNGNYFFSAGADLGYMMNNFNLYTRGNDIDLDDLDPSTHTGHISLYNQQFTMGPSVAFGAFQKSNWPLRVNVGYEWALYSGDWKSEFAEVSNSFKESGQGRFYAKLSLYLN